MQPWNNRVMSPHDPLALLSLSDLVAYHSSSAAMEAELKLHVILDNLLNMRAPGVSGLNTALQHMVSYMLCATTDPSAATGIQLISQGSDVGRDSALVPEQHQFFPGSFGSHCSCRPDITSWLNTVVST